MKIATFLLVLLCLTSGLMVVVGQDETPVPTATIQVTPTSTPVPLGNNIPYQKGLSVVLYGNDTTMANNTVGFFDDLQNRQLGADSLIFTFPIYMDGANSTVLYQDPNQTPSIENIRIFIREAHKRGYTVWLKPLIDDGRTGTWRGAITPGGNFNDQALDEWFLSYSGLMLQYAQLAQEEHILGLVIGTELESMDKDQPKYTTRWNDLIIKLRKVYSGNLSYAKNWSPVELPGFANSLDVLMIDAFFDHQALDGNATADEIALSWQANWLVYLQQYQQTLSIPVMFAEVGVVPRYGSFRTPWNGNNGGEMDASAQQRFYEGTCKFLKQSGATFGFKGAYWWAVGFYDHFENQYDRAKSGTITYNFYDFPAQDTLRQCYSS